MLTVTATVQDKSKKFSETFSYEQFQTKVGEGNDATTPVTQADVEELVKRLSASPNEDGSPNDEARKLVAATNYGINLRARSLARQKAEAKAEGPDKAIDKAVTQLTALGYSKDEALAIARAKLAKDAETADESDE